jgi:tyrosyl-tRNA synthetase
MELYRESDSSLVASPTMAGGDLAVLSDGAVDLVPEQGLRTKLELGRPLRVKLGVDPSRPDLTLGHAVVLRKLRQFQDAGHVAVLIIGDFTGRIGDPSGRSETRPMLSPDEIEANARTYLDQAGKVLDVSSAEIRRNAEWLAPMGMESIIRLTSVATIAQMLDRDDFRRRYDKGEPISVVEFLYPLLQGYDSVAVQSDVELGGTDQTFNLLMGREVQRAYGQAPQVVFTLPLLEGTDGVRKMSKSLNNYVALTDPPDDMFGKLMSIPDGLIVKYLRMCALIGPAEVAETEEGLRNGSLHPNQQKRRMARSVVDLYHGSGAGSEAEAWFDLVHRERAIPDDVPEVTVSEEWRAGLDRGFWLPRVLVGLGMASSNGEARRLIEQGGVRLDGEVVAGAAEELLGAELDGRVLQVGRRKFARLHASKP